MLYLRIGGMPGLKDSDLNEQVINQTLDGILSTVIMKDVINQSNITDTALLQKIILFLTDWQIWQPSAMHMAMFQHI